MADKYKTVQKSVTAIQYTFDTQKDVYLFLGMKDISFFVKNRTLTAIITGSNDEKINVNNTDWIVKSFDGTISVWTNDDFSKNFEKAEE